MDGQVGRVTGLVVIGGDTLCYAMQLYMFSFVSCAFFIVTSFLDYGQQRRTNMKSIRFNRIQLIRIRSWMPRGYPHRYSVCWPCSVRKKTKTRDQRMDILPGGEKGSFPVYIVVSFSRLAGLKAFVRSRFLVLLVCLLNVVEWSSSLPLACVLA
jgi:hypothetical protein